MAAYAALLSLTHIINQLQHHPHPPISLDKQQVDSFMENITFIQGFLEDYSSSGCKEDEELESRIADAAYAAEDIIESHIVDQIHVGSTSHGEKVSSVDFYQRVQKVIQDMDLIKQDMMVMIKPKMGVQDQLHRNSSISTGSMRPASTAQNNTIVGFDVFNEVLEKLIGLPDNLLIIPIVGMGGIGKTTLVRNIYANSHIDQRFDILAWVPISQEYSSQKILLQVLHEENKGGMNTLRMLFVDRMSVDELGEEVHKHLWGRRYLVVMDDIWSIEAWDTVKSFFPNNNNGSRIMMTTRLSNLAFQLSNSHVFKMNFLGEDKSWNLFCEIVFGKEGCPSELEKIGEEIAKNCRGLPLSIVVIGGLLAKSKITRGYWEYTLENLKSLINLENNEHCLQILQTSYQELPIHLKPCFMYMGVFPEDDEISVSKLIKLWVSEGFLKPINGKSLEVVAKEYLKELINRNLILVHKLGSNGKVSLCKIHDLLRDLCLREAQKQKFLSVLRQQDLNIPRGIDIKRRICICNDRREEYSPQILHALESAPLTRSLLLMRGAPKLSPSLSFRLLRVYATIDESFNFVRDSISLEVIFQQANLRNLSVEVDLYPLTEFPSTFSHLWNLQTLKVNNRSLDPIIAPSEIWEMAQLRHVMFSGSGLKLPDPPSWGNIVLENLQTLSGIYDFKCGDVVVKRIPNIKKLRLHYERCQEEGIPNYYHNNLGHLQKLKSLELEFDYCYISGPEILSHLVQKLTFSHSLKKLTLCCTKLYWKDLTTKIGSLPLLEVLKLEYCACIGSKWETVEGQFYSLKFLLIENCKRLKYWTTDSTHFPRLEHLILRFLPLLKEIPLSIGDIPTLQSIELYSCSNFAAECAKRIKEEQEELGNAGLKVQILEENIDAMKGVMFYKITAWEGEEEEEEEEEEERGVGQQIYNGLFQIWMAFKRCCQCFLAAQ